MFALSVELSPQKHLHARGLLTAFCMFALAFALLCSFLKLFEKFAIFIKKIKISLPSVAKFGFFDENRKFLLRIRLRLLRSSLLRLLRTQRWSILAHILRLRRKNYQFSTDFDVFGPILMKIKLRKPYGRIWLWKPYDKIWNRALKTLNPKNQKLDALTL